MEMPLASAAKRGCTFIFVPMMLAPPPHGPSDSIYWRMRGPDGEADPASANPKPSSMVFLPMAITFSGMSSYFVLTMNSETYLVRPGALANSSAGLGLGEAGWAGRARVSADPLPRANPASASDVLQKSRRIIGVPLSKIFRTCFGLLDFI